MCGTFSALLLSVTSGDVFAQNGEHAGREESLYKWVKSTDCTANSLLEAARISTELQTSTMLSMSLAYFTLALTDLKPFNDSFKT